MYNISSMLHTVWSNEKGMNMILLISHQIVRHVWDWKKSIFLKLGQVVIQCLFSQPQGTLQDEELFS